VRVRIGTSGYSYKEWKGNFYPDDLPAAKMLEFYASRFGTVEINATFYRMPEPKMLEKWTTQVPETFLFVLKAPQRITHQKRLAGAEDDVQHFFDVATVLGPQLGPVLFQLPPYAKKDAARLRAFIANLPPKVRVAFEFRHESWCDAEIESILRQRDAPMCLSDTDDVADPDALVVPTASWGYLRLRRTEYPGSTLGEWAARVQRQPWNEAWVFFKHEEEGKGPMFARAFRELTGEQ